jgi:VIT1/CCC1 family predicted Fe2+/Mn2+ transporter
MARPPLADWESVFGFSEDPAPGDPEVLERLASEYRSIHHDAQDARSVVSRLDSEELGEGKSMEKLRTKLGELPGQVGKLESSYEAAADAIAKYAMRLRDSQDQADRALDKGREAKERLDTAIVVAAAAGAHVTSLDNEEAPPPDDEKARSSARTALADARQEASDAARDVEAAQAELEAARLLALDAQELRVSDAGVAKRELEEAESGAVKAKEWWEEIGDWIAFAVSILGAVVGVVALFFGGTALAIIGLGLGAVSVLLSIVKGATTGEWDVIGIVLGVAGLAVGGLSWVKDWAGLGGLGKVGLGKWIRNLFKDWWPTYSHASTPWLELTPGGGPTTIHVPPMVMSGGPPELSKLGAWLDGLGFPLAIGGFIYTFLEKFGYADDAKVYTNPW